VTVTSAHGSAPTAIYTACITRLGPKFNRTTCGDGFPDGPDLVAEPGATLTVTVDRAVFDLSVDLLSGGDVQSLPQPVRTRPRSYAVRLPAVLPLPRQFSVFLRFDDGDESGDTASSVRLVAPNGVRALLAASAPAATSWPFHRLG